MKKKSSVKLRGNQLLDLKHKLKIEDALDRIQTKIRKKMREDLAGVATLLFKELGLWQPFNVSSRQDKVSSCDA